MFIKTEQMGLPGSNFVWHSIRFGHWISCSFRWRFDGRRWGTRRWLCVLYWSFLWRLQWRRLDKMCEIFQMGAHTMCWYGRRFCLWAMSRIKIVLFLVCILCIFIFLCFFTILCVFFVNSSPPQIRNTRVPNFGIWSFCGNEFYTHFSFHNVWCYVATVSSLNV